MINLILACVMQVGVNVIGLPDFHKLYKSDYKAKHYVAKPKSKYHS